MLRLSLKFASFLAAASIFGFNSSAAAQGAAGGSRAAGEAFPTRLVLPIYPPIARAANIAGDVVIAVAITQAGTVLSTAIISGPPLLSSSALESAKQSQFDCRNCESEPTKLQLIYTYQLLPGTCNDQPGHSDKVKPGGGVPGVTQDSNHITIVDFGVIICDPAVALTHVRSWKCLYLWKCAAKKVPAT